MKKWVIVVTVVIAVITIGGLAASAFAYSASQQTYRQYGQYSSYLVPGVGGGMMGNSHSTNKGYSSSNGYFTQSAPNVNGYGGCMGRRGLP